MYRSVLMLFFFLFCFIALTLCNFRVPTEDHVLERFETDAYSQITTVCKPEILQYVLGFSDDAMPEFQPKFVQKLRKEYISPNRADSAGVRSNQPSKNVEKRPKLPPDSLSIEQVKARDKKCKCCLFCTASFALCCTGYWPSNHRPCLEPHLLKSYQPMWSSNDAEMRRGERNHLH